jgi:hypothetical protein
MADREHTKQPVEEYRPHPTDGVPEEEGLGETDTRDPTGVTPEGHVNRPDQPDFDPEEREQYQQPVEESPLREDG